MASADSTFSPRDHAADANPERARKKQRLSEDPGASPTESIIIEVDDPEDIGATMDNAIQIEDSLDPIGNYSSDFQTISGTVSPLQFVQSVHNSIQGSYYMNTQDFAMLAQAIRDHCADRQDESSEWHQHYLDDEAEFFNWMVTLCRTMLDTGDLLNLRGKVDPDALTKVVGDLLYGLSTLCSRVIPALPSAIKIALSRRDSAHFSTRQHTIEGLNYVLLAAQVVCKEESEKWPPTLRILAKSINLEAVLQNIAIDFSSEEIITSLSTIIKILGGAMRDIKDSWVFFLSALSLFETAVTTSAQLRSYAKAEVASVMDIINTYILPTIREKHPRALPETFHTTILKWGQKAMLQHIRLLDPAAAASAFQLFVSSPSDALVPETVDEGSVGNALQQLCGGSQEVLAPLIADSWFMQTAKSYLRSDIMDIRYVGLGSIDRRLVQLYHEYRHSPEGFEHPVVQHAIRFMRKNEIIPYMFGPESRASLLNKSCDVVTFLAATHTYTDAETDVIWRACSTNVEADFVKASFEVLIKVNGFLEFEHLMYIARKYSTSSITCFGLDALEFLPLLLQNIELKSSQLMEASDRLAMAFVSIEILKKANCSHPCITTERLKRTVLTAISRLSSHPFSSEDREQIYKFCVPDILDQTVHATTSVDVLLTLLPRSRHSSEAETLLRLLPVDAAVEELCGFVQARKQSQAPRSEIGTIISRLDCLGHLISLSSVVPETSSQERLFQYMFGSEAFSNDAREVAWQRLRTIAFDSGSSPVLKSLFQEYMKDRVAALPSNFATPKLIEIIHLYLRTILAEEYQGDTGRLLHHPLWHALAQFAIMSPDDVVNTASVSALLDILFGPPEEGDTEMADTAAECQNEFVRRHIDRLSSLKDEFVDHPSQENIRRFAIAIKILQQVFSRSQEYQSANKMTLEPDVLILREPVGEDDQIEFIAQIYSISAEPRPVKVMASPSAQISELLARLPSITSAAENRIIANGVEITDLLHKTLIEAGVRESGVVLIRPKFSNSVDLDKLLTPPGPVEQAILSQYSTLEAFLDGPPQIAQSARLFLEKIRLSAATRFRVVSSPASADDLFPKDGQQRAFFSLFILRAHLSDFARLGLADRGFILRATQLLTAFVLDRNRVLDPHLMFGVLETLCVVLTERPRNDQELEYFKNGNELAARLIELSFNVSALPVQAVMFSAQAALRSELGAILYKTIVLAYQRSRAVWSAFIEHGAVPGLHGRLLLDNDMKFSVRVSQILESVLYEDGVPQERAKFYWQVLYSNLSNALVNSYLSESYFALINKALSLLGSVDCEEAWITKLVEELCSKIWSYKHEESPPLLTSDKAMLGLLRLFSKSVSILKKKQKSSHLLAGLPSKLFRHFLFPPKNDRVARPLVQEETRTIVYNLIRATCSKPSDHDELAALTNDAIKDSVREAAGFPGMSEWFRPACNPSGLTNLGMTCYMNSLLQQLFGNLQFRKFILDQTIVDHERQATLASVQSLFANMQDSVSPFAETNDLARVLNVQVGVQDDVHTFYTNLLSRLEESMPNTESRQVLNGFFTGKSVTQIRGDCGHVSSKEEPFTELSITVKNKASLHDSLDEFVQGEPLEGANKYMCMSCGSNNEGLLVNALRRTCLDNLPNGLTFCLKRFAFESILDGENKVNDRFEFPAEIDMSHYKRSHLENPAEEYEPDMFELVGVIVHQGSLTYGHYWSYVRVPAPQNLYRCPWMYLEDNKYRPCPGGIQEVQESCFGGLHWADGSERPESAYVLFYQRKNFITEADSLNGVAKSLQIDQQVLPKIRLQQTVEAPVHHNNEWRMRVALFFQDQFYGYLKWLCDQYASRMQRMQLQQNTGSSQEESDQQGPGHEAAGSEPLDAHIGELITDYVLQIFLSDPQCEDRLDQLMKSILTLIRLKPAIATHIIRRFAQDEFGFKAILRHGDPIVRSTLLRFFFECLMAMRLENSRYYNGTAVAIINLHCSLLDNLVESRPPIWREYLKFAADFASIGPDETRLVLDRVYMIWAFGILYMNYDVKRKQDHLALWKHFRNGWLDRTALYEFLHDLLDGHVDLSEMPRASDPAARVRTAQGWRLEGPEANALVFLNPKTDKKGTGLLIEIGVRCCGKRVNNWREYGPGKLIGLLVGEKTHFLMSEKICDFMRIQYELEDRELEPLLYMTLHIILQLPHVAGGMQRCEMLMDTLCKDIHEWESKERRTLWFFREVHELAPGLIIRCFSKWADRFLRANNHATRQLTAECLKEMVFDHAALQDEAIEASRIANTREFVDVCHGRLREACARRDSRAFYEPMIVSFEHANEYLDALKEEIEQRQENGDTISEMVMVQWEETKSLVPETVRFLEHLQEWEPTTALPTRSLGVRRSVEIDDSEELDTSDADAEDDFSDASASGW